MSGGEKQPHPASLDLKTMLDLNPNPIAVIDSQQLSCVFQNQASQASFGDLKGELCHAKMFQNPAPCSFCKRQQAIETDSSQQSEVKLPDGRWLLIQFAPIKKSTGGQVDILETHIDITAQKEKTEELQETVDLLRESLGASGLLPEDQESGGTP